MCMFWTRCTFLTGPVYICTLTLVIPTILTVYTLNNLTREIKPQLFTANQHWKWIPTNFRLHYRNLVLNNLHSLIFHIFGFLDGIRRKIAVHLLFSCFGFLLTFIRKCFNFKYISISYQSILWIVTLFKLFTLNFPSFASLLQKKIKKSIFPFQMSLMFISSLRICHKILRFSP